MWCFTIPHKTINQFNTTIIMSRQKLCPYCKYEWIKGQKEIQKNAQDAKRRIDYIKKNGGNKNGEIN